MIKPKKILVKQNIETMDKFKKKKILFLKAPIIFKTNKKRYPKPPHWATGILKKTAYLLWETVSQFNDFETAQKLL